jgi:drug/metabolite transporter (DMT)-like permease
MNARAKAHCAKANRMTPIILPLENTGLALLAFSAFLHALWNSWLKREEHKEAFLTIVITLACALAWIGVAGFARPNAFAGLESSLASGVFEGLYLASLSRTLSLAPLAWAYAIMRGGAMVMVWLFSSLLMGERTGAFGALGAVLIFAGLWVPVAGLRRTGAARAGITGAGIRAALLSATFISGYHFFYDRALEQGAEPFRLFAISLSVSVPILLATLLGKGARGKLQAVVELCGNRPVFALACATVVYWSFVLFLMGLESTGAGFAITLRNTSIFYALVLAHLSGERIQRLQVWSCVLIFAGAICLGWS